MSNLKVMHWTNLPKGMNQDFVSHSTDYDFPFYLSEKEEWIHLKNIKGKVIISEPFLILELNRFVPYLEGVRVKFHPLNMPHVKVGKIEIMGFVVCVSEDAKFYKYQVDDGTGTIVIFYTRENFLTTINERTAIDDKYDKYLKNINVKLLKTQECPKRFPNPRPNFEYPVGTSVRDMVIFEHNWSLETNNGTLGKEVQRCSYVHAVGYCTLDFLCGKRPKEEITFEDLSNAKLNFIATKVTCISEHEYNRKLCSWISTFVRKRYDGKK